MRKNFLITIVYFLCSYCGYSQIKDLYTTIDIKNVLYYKVEEIKKVKYGASITRYKVSDISLISNTDLGPNNVRIIIPIFKDSNSKKENHYVQTNNLNNTLKRDLNLNDFVQVKFDADSIKFIENTGIKKELIKLVVNHLKRSRPEDINSIKSKTNNYIVKKSSEKDNYTEFSDNTVETQNPHKENRKRIKKSKTDTESSEKNSNTELTDNVLADHDSQKENRSGTKKIKTDDELVKKSSKK
ncbi:hypothetical protein ACEN2I_19755, partial [Flavobacterium sp. W22_SRS_FK3]